MFMFQAAFGIFVLPIYFLGNVIVNYKNDHVLFTLYTTGLVLFCLNMYQDRCRNVIVIKATFYWFCLYGFTILYYMAFISMLNWSICIYLIDVSIMYSIFETIYIDYQREIAIKQHRKKMNELCFGKFK